MNRANEREFNVPVPVLAIDIGAGTQDILIYSPGRPIENSEKMVMPSRTQVVARAIEAATRNGQALHLSGRLMGGGASSSAVEKHLAAGLPVTGTADAVRTIHNRPERVAKLGIQLTEARPDNAVEVELGDVDLAAIGTALGMFGIETPSLLAIAVQDHGFREGAGNNDVRFEYLQSLVDDGGDLGGMAYRVPPAGMTRMQSIAAAVPGVVMMDTGAAAILGVRGDPVARDRIERDGAVVVNVGNMHTFAALVKGDRLYGLFEHHSHGMNAALLGRLVDGLRSGALDPVTFHHSFDGHGAAFSADYRTDGPFDYVVVTGPNRSIARTLGYYEAAPFGDMMLTGSFGLIEAVGRLLLRDMAM